VKEITITLRGTPTPYRHQSAPTGHRYLPKKQRDQLAMLRAVASEPMDGQVRLTSRSGSRSGSNCRSRDPARGNNRRSTTRQLSNLLKLAEDACIGVVFRDDSFVCAHLTRNRYSMSPGITIVVAPLRPDHP